VKDHPPGTIMGLHNIGMADTLDWIAMSGCIPSLSDLPGNFICFKANRNNFIETKFFLTCILLNILF